MPYLEFKMLKQNLYVYAYHKVRLGQDFVKVYLGYLGPVERIAVPGSPDYDPDIKHFLDKRERNLPFHRQDKTVMRRILRRYNIPFDPDSMKDRAEEQIRRRSP